MRLRLEEAKKLVLKHTEAVIAHYQVVNESSRKNPAACARRESNTVFDLLAALGVDQRPSEQDCEDCM